MLTPFPIEETSSEAFRRRDFPHIVGLDASTLRDAAERDALQRPLIWNEDRAATLRDADNPAVYNPAANTAHGDAIIDPHLVGQILGGDWHGAVRRVIASGADALTGDTPAVRRELTAFCCRTALLCRRASSVKWSITPFPGR